MNNLCLTLTQEMRDNDLARWIAVFDDFEVWQDDDIQYGAFGRLREYCHDNEILPNHFDLRFRSHRERAWSYSSNIAGLYFSKYVLAGMFMEKNKNGYVVASINPDMTITGQIWHSPEIINVEGYSGHYAAKLEDHVIWTKEYKYMLTK